MATDDKKVDPADPDSKDDLDDPNEEDLKDEEDEEDAEDAEDEEELTIEEQEDLQEENEALKAKIKQADKRYADLRTDYDEKATDKNLAKKTDDIVEDTTDWKIINARKIRMAGESYMDEVQFLKDNSVPLTEETLKRALTHALNAKKIGKKVSTKEKADTADTIGGENRKSSKEKIPMPANFIGTQEEFDILQQEIEEEKIGD